MKPRRKVPRETRSPALADQVAALLTERAQLVVRMEAIDKTLAAVRSALGFGAYGKLPEVARPGADETDRTRPPRARDTAAELAHPNRDNDRTEAIFHLLGKAPASVREVALWLREDRLIVKQALQQLKRSGALTTIGIGPGTRYTRVTATPPEARAVASPPTPPPAVLRAHTVSKTDLASVEARDQTVLRYLRAHIATLEQLTKALPPEAGLSADQFDAACEAAVTRLSAKGLIVRSGKAWTAAVVTGARVLSS